MKIVAFTDFHSSKSSLKRIAECVKKEKPDIAVCCGDMTVFERGIKEVMQALGRLPVPVILVHGNHEEPALVQKFSKKYKNMIFLHKKTKVVGGILFVGYGGEGFSRTTKDFEHFIKKQHKKIKSAGSVVLLTHQPPYGTKLDLLYEDFVGNRSFSECIKTYSSIKLALSGHIHETFGKRDKLNNARLLNPGPDGTLVSL